MGPFHRLPCVSNQPAPCPPKPARPRPHTNLGRQECAWRSSVLSLSGLQVELDVSCAACDDDSAPASFTVTSTLDIEIHTAFVEGLWVDFMGEAVTSLQVDGAPTDVSWDGARLELPGLKHGKHQVHVEAQGLYSNSGQGLHRFKDPVDQAVYLYTHFEPSDARRAWPCLDQPDLKAPFTLTATHPSQWTLLSNGRPSKKEAVLSGEPAHRTSFSTTAPVPSYLTAFAAGPWHRVEGQWRSKSHPGLAPVPLSWSCRASLAKHLDADELLATTRAGLDLYDATYDFAYPWGSYDSVLVPEYNLGAMENPGCVTFNEDLYLYRGPATQAQRGARANVIMHEMCHMWFGDLVTPKWWDDTWLKESFADHQGTWAQEQASPYKDAWVAFAAGRKAWAYLEDSRAETTHPIVASVEDVEAARQTFDGITYAKGASVLKQLVAYVGQEAFVRAASLLFKQQAFSNATLADLLEALRQASGRDTQAWARAWLSTCGPSVITTGLETSQGSVTALRLTQACTDPLTGQEVLRPHTLKVGLYSFDSAGGLVRTHLLPVTFSTTSTEVPGAQGLPAPDLVTVNDEDLTYAIVRPDPASLQVALSSLRRLEDPLARAVWWSMLHNLLRDAQLRPQTFVQAVLEQADDATAPATLSLLLDQARLASRCCPPDERVQALAPLTVADATGAKGPSAWSLLELDDDLRWAVLASLAQLGRLEEADTVSQQQRDPSASGVVSALRVRWSAPKAQDKEEVFARLLADQSLSNEHMDALLAAFGPDAHRHLTATLTSRYLGALEQVWSTRGQEVATRLVNGLFPHAGDHHDAEAVRSWLGANTQAPSALRHLLLKSVADLERSLRCQDAAQPV